MRNTYTKSLLALSVISALGAVTAPSYAQEMSAEDVEIIEVQGFRSSLIKGRDLKRSSAVSQDSIVAEDIAAFPDLNLAESLQRISVITITREGGEGRQISLLGLGPRLSLSITIYTPIYKFVYKLLRKLMLGIKKNSPPFSLMQP